MAETQVVQLQCPNCGTQYQSPVRSVIDVGQEPRLRDAMLSGTINQTVCPNCKQAGILEVPLVYHDPAAEFLAVYFPAQLQIPELERQRMIGELTQGLMRNLPPEQRKGYFLNPRQFINRESLMDAILGTMGISQEDLDRQRKKLDFLERLTVMADDPKGLQMMIKGQDGMLDQEFFALISTRVAQAQAVGDEKAAERLTLLRESLIPVTTYGQRLARQRAAVDSLGEVTSPEQLLDKLAAADLEEATAMAVVARPLLDYAFFQALTARVDAATGAEKERLTKLRDHLVDVTQTLDEATRSQMREAAELLQHILQSPDPREALRENIAELDDVFMSVLALNMQEAEKRGAKDALERLNEVYEEIQALVQESLPPEMRLVNDLLAADYPEDTRSMLKSRRAELTPEVLSLMEELAASLAESDEPEASETAKRLRDIRAQAMLLA